MNKKLISSILVVALLNLCGCFSYSALTEEDIDNNRPTSDEAFKIILKDGSEIEYQPTGTENLFIWNEFIRIDKPSDLVVGIGKLLDKKTQTNSIFNGTINRAMIDSSKSTIVDNMLYEIYWLKDSTRVAFRSCEHFDITPDKGIGYWIAGNKAGDRFCGKIEFDDVKEIQEAYIISPTAATWIIGGVSVILLVGMLIVAFTFDFNLNR